jgi:hypothetical protein
MPTAPPTRNRLPLVLSGLVVLISLLLGGAFVFWEMKNSGGGVVKLSDTDVETLQSVGKQMQFKDAGGVPLQGNQVGPGRRPAIRLRQPTAADSITNNGNITLIQTGQVMVRIQAGVNPPAITFKQRMWGELPDRPVFTIARRIVHEESLAKQLAVTQEQLRQLTAIVATPPLKSAYITALPVSSNDLDTAQKAWAAFTASPNRGPGPVQVTLFKALKQIGDNALAKARSDYADSAKAINSILQHDQIQAYNQGKSLASTQH